MIQPISIKTDFSRELVVDPIEQREIEYNRAVSFINNELIIREGWRASLELLGYDSHEPLEMAVAAFEKAGWIFKHKQIWFSFSWRLSGIIINPKINKL